MGYSAEYFPAHVSLWVTEGWLPAGGSVVDFGSQELSGEPAAIEAGVAAFLHQCNATSNPTPRTVREVYERAGFEYVSLDVDGLRGSRYFDLNCFAAPDDLRGRFDIVNNEGTIEHLANPINGFNVAHDLAKPGAVIRHSMPLFGWRYHGMFCPTPKFYGLMVAANGYEVLQSRASFQPATEAFCDGIILDIENETFEPKPSESNAWIHLTYRKVGSAPFNIPVDHLFEAEDPGGIAGQMRRDFDEAIRR